MAKKTEKQKDETEEKNIETVLNLGNEPEELTEEQIKHLKKVKDKKKKRAGMTKEEIRAEYRKRIKKH